MSWFRVDDGLPESDNLEMLEPWPERHALAVAAWTMLGADCMKPSRRTDGFVSDRRLARVLPWPEAMQQTAAEALVFCKLWERVEGGYRFVKWLDYQPSKQEMDAERKAATERQKRWRQKRRQQAIAEQSTGVDGVTNASTHAVTDAVTTGVSRRSGVASAVDAHVDAAPSRPVPTLPISLAPQERENARALSGLDSAEGKAVKATSALRIAFARKYEDVRGLEWGRAGDPAVEELGGWLSRNTLDVDVAIAALLQRFFADPYAIKNDFPIGLLNKQAARLLEPPKAVRDVRKGFVEPAPASAFKNPTDLDKLFGPEKPAAGGVRG